MSAEQVTFHSGAIQLRGTLVKPDAPGPRAAVIILHAAGGGTRAYPFYQHLQEQLPARGVAVLTFDRRGSGASGGDFTTADFDDLAADGAAAFRCLRRRTDIDPTRIGLYGISQGGWIAPLVAVKEPDAAFLVIVSGCALPPAAQMDYAARYTLREAGFSAAVQEQALALRRQTNEYFRGAVDREALTAALRQFENEPWFAAAYLDPSAALPADPRASKWYYEMDYDPLPVWQQVSQPTLFLFGDRDRWVPVAASRATYRQATAHMSDVDFVTLAEIDHLMGERDRQDESRVSERYFEILWAWLEARLR